MFVLVICLTSSCGFWDDMTHLGAENPSRHAFMLQFENTSESEYRYIARGFATSELDEVLRSYSLESVAPGSTIEVPAGSLDGPSPELGCLDDQQFWVVRSRSGTPWERYYEEPFAPPRDVEDFEVISHIEAGVCFPDEADRIIRIDS